MIALVVDEQHRVAGGDAGEIEAGEVLRGRGDNGHAWAGDSVGKRSQL